ncbi:hypothetical protein QO034_05685 [Sedimentitalea sp. JM2-8]|uniref:Uncharacterized protein n=1 Tax=Sedimentitalea xiamensis TaxID=3050037 RepID=A0ABT7FBV2_9RHOB|nr:hypothetical protein [Sedimentitalea xiamensis]MDK3072594.1 hypothetical protein [Sedimentitalea xiamensis]
MIAQGTWRGFGNLRAFRLSKLARAGVIGAIALTAQPSHAANDPPFTSMADTVFDVIRETDPSTFVCLHYEGRVLRQMWDKRLDDEFDLDAFLFSAHFTDMPPIEILLNPEFETPELARAEAERYGYRLGQLPLVFRHGIRQLGVHKGDEGFHAGSGKIFVYSEMSERRIEQNRLEESLLHESVHATLDNEYRLSPEWIAAQESDGRFLTRYAASRPEREDLADTALFAYALLRHPGRIPPVDSLDILRTVPARIGVIENILDRAPDVPEPPPVPEGCL